MFIFVKICWCWIISTFVDVYKSSFCLNFLKILCRVQNPHCDSSPFWHFINTVFHFSSGLFGFCGEVCCHSYLWSSVLKVSLTSPAAFIYSFKICFYWSIVDLQKGLCHVNLGLMPYLKPGGASFPGWLLFKARTTWGKSSGSPKGSCMLGISQILHKLKTILVSMVNP